MKPPNRGVRCPHCGGLFRVIKKVLTVGNQNKRRLQCRDCGERYTSYEKFGPWVEPLPGQVPRVCSADSVDPT